MALEFEGKDLEEALAVAARALNVSAENLHFTLISVGSKGFLGLGRRKAKIRVKENEALTDGGPTAENSVPAQAEASGVKAERRAPVAPANNALDARTIKRRAVDQAGRDSTPPVDREGRKKSRREPFEDEINLGPPPPPPTRPGPAETIYDGPPDERMTAAGDILKNIITRLGLEAEVETRRIGDRIILSVDGVDGAALIGQRGATLEALQYLTYKIFNHKFRNAGAEGEEAAQILVDVADYRARRQTHLLETARVLAQEALRLGKAQTMPGLNASERRLLHTVLKPVKGLRTQSVGVGSLRDLLLKRVS